MGKPYGWDFCEEANDAIQEAIREDNERRDKEDIYYPEWIFPIEEAQSYCLKNNLAFCFYRYNPWRLEGGSDFFMIQERALSILHRYRLCGTFAELNRAAICLENAFIMADGIISTSIDFWETFEKYEQRKTILSASHDKSKHYFNADGIFETNRPPEEIKPCFFALQALMFIGEIANSEAGLNEEWNHYSLSVTNAAAAAEFVCIAEILANNADKAELIKTEIGRNAANARHAKGREKKAEAQRLWLEELKKEKPRSKSKFAKDLNPKINIEAETIKKWLTGLPNKPKKDEDDSLPF